MAVIQCKTFIPLYISTHNLNTRRFLKSIEYYKNYQKGMGGREKKLKNKNGNCKNLIYKTVST